MLKDLSNRSFGWRLDAFVVLMLIVLAFAVRIDRIGFNSLSEDETAKWLAIQEYRHGHFAGINSEHPMLLKMLAWGALTAGERWNHTASARGWTTISAEGSLRLPNVILGSLTAGLLYLICRQAMGRIGSLTAGFFWAVALLPVALNRLVKEETPVTFFTLLAILFFWYSKNAQSEQRTRRWLDLSCWSFGLGLASQYLIHLFGLNALAWFIAGRRGIDRKAAQSRLGRETFMILLAFLLANPAVLSPTTFTAILHWLHHDLVRHTGYAFDGTLYLNFASRAFAGVPWYFYLWLLTVKTPVPFLVAILCGSILLLRDRRNFASCLFISFGLVQLAGLSLCGSKWIRYSLPLLPFLYMAGGYAVQSAWNCAKGRPSLRLPISVAAIVLFAWPMLEVHAWTPYDSFYLNEIGGGSHNIARYFTPDEVSEFDSREVANAACVSAPNSARLATGRPLSLAFYVRSCGRHDIQVVALYDPAYTPGDGDLIVLEPSRRFVETERYFDVLESSKSPHSVIWVGSVSASRIYRLQTADLAALSKPDTDPRSIDHTPDLASVHASSLWPLSVRWQTWLSH